jgi:hypothetical protein
MAVPTKDIFTSVHHLIHITNLGLSESNGRRDPKTTPLSKEETSRGYDGWQKKSAISLISKLSRTVFSKTLHPCPVPQLLKGTFLSSIEQLHTLYSISLCVYSWSYVECLSFPALYLLLVLISLLVMALYISDMMHVRALALI